VRVPFSGKICRNFFGAGGGKGLEKNLHKYYFLLRSSRVKSHVITIHMDNRLVAEGKGDSEGNEGEGSKSDNG
jgi:hypothetical protein